jgi:hypothetical protein
MTPLAPTERELLARLLDESACRAVLARYGAAIDWQDRPGLETVFWPDAEIDYGFFKGSGADLVSVLLQIATLSLRRFHMLGGERLQIAGDIAHAESYILTQAISQGPDGAQQSSLFYGRFIDRLERRQGEWRIGRRNYLQHGAYAGPYAENAAPIGLPNADGLDPAHPLFRRL